MAGTIDEVIHGRRMSPAGEVMSGFVEGQVIAVSNKGMTFKVKDWDGGKQKFGPAPYPRLDQLTTTATAVGDHGTHTHNVVADPSPNQPVKGDRCLVVFTDNGPWVIGWWPK